MTRENRSGSSFWILIFEMIREKERKREKEKKKREKNENDSERERGRKKVNISEHMNAFTLLQSPEWMRSKWEKTRKQKDKET